MDPAALVEQVGQLQSILADTQTSLVALQAEVADMKAATTSGVEAAVVRERRVAELEGRVTHLAMDIAALDGQVSVYATRIDGHETEISMNAEAIAGATFSIATNAAALSRNASDVAWNASLIASNAAAVSSHAHQIADQQIAMADIEDVVDELDTLARDSATRIPLLETLVAGVLASSAAR